MFTPFLDARQNAGHHVDLLFPNQTDVWSGEAGSSEAAMRWGVTLILEPGLLCEPPSPALLPTPLHPC